MTSSWF